MNQALVDDGLVDMDKIGSSNFFWSFPSKVVVTRQNIVDSLTRDIAKVSEEIVMECVYGHPSRHPPHYPSCSVAQSGYNPTIYA